MGVGRELPIAFGSFLLRLLTVSDIENGRSV